MRRRLSGQSVVEMAFILPLLVMITFGIIDIGYYIYGYATIYQSARNGAEKASHIPPYPSRISPTLDRYNDECVSTILKEIQSDASLFPDLTADAGLNDRIQISYPTDPATGVAGRELGKPIQVAITYNIRPLTPLWNFVTFGNKGTMQVRTVARRSIEALGNNPNTLYAPNLVACNP